MSATVKVIRGAIGARLLPWLAITLGTVALYYGLLVASLVVRFGNWPNYVVGYDWPGNVARIFASTPSFNDAIAIAQEEWLLEAGYMNMDFGHGISEWSLTLVPPKMAVILLLGALVATIWALTRVPACSRGAPDTATVVAASGLGTGLVALTGATMTWVVCCASPSWIVGLAMLGVGVATANWLEPIGPWLSLGGFLLLGATVIVLARRQVPVKAKPADMPELRPAHAGELQPIGIHK